MRRFRSLPLYIAAYAVLTLLYVVFLVSVAVKYGVNINFFVLAVLVVPVLLRLVALLKREVVISEEGIEIRDLFKSGFVKWSDIESVGFSSRRRTFLFIVTRNKDGYLIDDSVENFKNLLEEVGKRVDKGKLPENWEDIVSGYKPSYGGIVLVTLAILVIGYVVLKSLSG
ncbi:PH domain-containing protein [Desulfurobacterium sp.]